MALQGRVDDLYCLLGQRFSLAAVLAVLLILPASSCRAPPAESHPARGEPLPAQEKQVLRGGHPRLEDFAPGLVPRHEEASPVSAVPSFSLRGWHWVALPLLLAVLALASRAFPFRSHGVDSIKVSPTPAQKLRKLVLVTSATASISVLCATLFASKNWWLEQWYLGKLKARDESERYQAMEHLGELGSASAVPFLLEIVDRSTSGDSSSGLRFVSPEGLAALRAMDEIGPSAVSKLALAMSHKSPNVRLVACAVLSQIKQKPAEILPAVTSLLSDTDPDVRASSAYLLGQFGSEAKQSVPAVTKLLEDKVPIVRSLAASALGKMGPDAKAALPLLIAASHDPDALLRHNAEEALASICDGMQLHEGSFSKSQ